MTGPYQTILTDTPVPHVLRVTLNRPEVANAFNTQMMRDLLALWQELAVSAEPPRCIVLTGAGDRAFCAGADLKERNTLSEAQWMAQHVIIEEQFKALIECPVPVIAAANGHAFAGGLEMLLACDFAYAVRAVRFALTEVTLGLMPGAGGTQTLSRAVGERRAKEIILTGKPFAALEALEWGVVNALYEPDALMPAALETATRIATNAPIAVKEARRSIHGGLQKDLAAAMRFEIECYNKLVPTEDRAEGIRAFNEKRKPVFKGR
ncbi:MAG TPA: enoyl-CoA hydratase-related protein [Stellaceae bacterium]|jgi:enoyl-CoA hydratase/carnithine racemase|nr:enoyl-CoA hydratase-related protein [Stellaceae bacterium]